MGRPAAAVDQHDRLPRALAQLGERRARCGRKRPLAPVALAHVDDLDRRQRAPVDALGQLDPLELAASSRAAGVAEPATSDAPPPRSAPATSRAS